MITGLPASMRWATMSPSFIIVGSPERTVWLGRTIVQGSFFCFLSSPRTRSCLGCRASMDLPLASSGDDIVASRLLVDRGRRDEDVLADAAGEGVYVELHLLGPEHHELADDVPLVLPSLR